MDVTANPRSERRAIMLSIYALAPERGHSILGL